MSLLRPEIASLVRSLGYAGLLPVQERSIPVVLSGSHALIVAPTGSGKTEAALFPVLSRMVELRESGSLGGGVKLVYVTPLRALNRDVARRVESIVRGAGFSIYIRHGDTTARGRREFLESPPDVVVTTPETLNLVLTVRERRGVWEGVRWVVVDEVHELLESKRGSELSVVLERLEMVSGRRIQRIGLSATLSKRGMIEAARLLGGGRRVAIVEEPGHKRYEVEVRIVDYTEEFWEHSVRELASIARSSGGSTLIFTNTRSAAEKQASSLSRHLGEGGVAVHHGSLSRVVRERAERDFRSGSVKALVATSSMELGIDIGHVETVAQFLSPRQVIAMAQRAGRSGHRPGLVSRGVIVTVDNIFEALESGVIAFRTERGHLEDLRAPKLPLDALAHQVAALVREGSASTLDEVYEVVSRAYPYHELSKEELSRVIEHLGRVDVLRVGGGRLREGRRLRRYLYRVTMIPDERNYSVVDSVTGSRVGEVGERFVEASLLQEGERFRFVLAGRVWEALDVDLEYMRITAKPVALAEGHVPSWEGELIPVSHRVAREVCSIMELSMADREASMRLMAARKIPAARAEKYARVLEETSRLWGGAVLSHRNPVIEEYEGGSVLYACLGSKGNFALALLLSRVAEGVSRLQFEHIPYAIVFTSPGGVGGQLVSWALKEASRLSRLERASMVLDSVRASKAYLVRFLHVARRMGVLDPDQRMPYSLLRRMVEAYRGSVVDEETLRELMHEKLDMEAVNEFLDSMGDPVVVSPGSLTPLARQVFENPYLRKDSAANIKMLALDAIIEAKRRALRGKTAIIQCASCGHSYKVRVSEARGKLSCGKCSSSLQAPLPDTEWGEKASSIFKEYKKGARLGPEDKKLVAEVLDRAMLYINYASQGLGEYVIAALMTRGVGPRAARRVMRALLDHGEKGFYRELIKVEEEFISNRKYWERRPK